MSPMIEVVESVSDKPLRFLPSKTASLNIGDIVELTEEGGNVCIKLSDGTKPFGIVSDLDGPFGLISVWYETMVLRTNNYEPNCRYKSGSSLYVSKNGKLTTEAPYEDAYMLGHVISPPGANQVHLEMNWI